MGPMNSDPNKRLIILGVITFSGFHCTYIENLNKKAETKTYRYFFDVLLNERKRRTNFLRQLCIVTIRIFLKRLIILNCCH